MAAIPPSVDEPLAESAPLARRKALELCRRHPVSGDTCAWYHGTWQYLRLLGLVDTPELDADFLAKAVYGAASAGRVLISGAADYSILARVHAAFHAAGGSVVFTVLDNCATPLYLNRWYAERTTCQLNTECNDIFAYSPKTQFDALCAHSFLVHVPAVRRAALVGRWASLLRPGGVLITASRIWPGEVSDRIAFTDSQVAAFRDAALRNATRLREALDLQPEELADIAATYARKRSLHTVRSTDEVLQLLQAGGFQIEQFVQSEAPIEARENVDGRAAGSTRVRVVARRL